ncbi:AGR010Cp [Eremothecium gossypii ATCC 10895]|uniref:AGR010Cp n=1 Tax=Eremothecium gossypii (strain ATCC 10895 / CBS 109.51 / FGSC 9923 / NRRL Y-1056) TaxID=284811 RepID=Q750E5_EREGS|nr:AGR010Cp [Eremothecium gossypii ATCC 10895]AAS54499.1 AGR010Cp [Eremothecium gossypii ATCC 10895]AEY98831.1 FAGR010Cp [Eremothecium gossypii FDAG1]
MNKSGNGRPSRTVYLGSIPYDQTEQQILDLCSNVGPVTGLKMMFDPQTGKSKGYAFIEFKDLATSSSAVRNLNGYALGNRTLKCGYTTGGGISEEYSLSNRGELSQVGGMGPQEELAYPNLPEGADVNINMTTPAMVISSELSKLSKPEQFNLLEKLQEMSRNDREAFVALLKQCPQISFVVAELLLTNGISQIDDLTQLAVDQTNGSAASKDSTPQVGEDDMQKLELLKQVLQLTDAEIATLPEDERMSLWDLKQRAMKGEFGPI